MQQPSPESPAERGKAPSSVGAPTDSGAAIDADTAARIAALEQRTLDYWLAAVSSTASGSAQVQEFQRSFSWRVTAPLRTVRGLQIKAARVGYRNAAVIGVARVRRNLGDRARGK